MQLEFSSVMAKLKGANPVTTEILPPFNWLKSDKRNVIKGTIYFDDGQENLKAILTMADSNTDLTIRLTESYYHADFGATLVNAQIKQISTERKTDEDYTHMVVMVEYDHVQIDSDE